MTEAQSHQPSGDAGAEPVRTGVVDVDRALEDIEGLDAVDVGDHPAVFERTHEQLRRALDGTDGTD